MDEIKPSRLGEEHKYIRKFASDKIILTADEFRSIMKEVIKDNQLTDDEIRNIIMDHQGREVMDYTANLMAKEIHDAIIKKGLKQ